MSVAVPVEASPHARRSRSSGRARVERRGWLFVAPFLAVFALVFLAPIAYAVWLSLFREQVFFGGTTFVGLDNYVAALGDDKFWSAFGRVLVFLVVQVPIMLLLALVAALAIDSARLHAAGVFRIVIFLPYAVPSVVAALMWGFIHGQAASRSRSTTSATGRCLLCPRPGGNEPSA